MIIYRLKRKTSIGYGFNKMTLDRDVLFFKNKEDAKKLQNRFKGDKVEEVVISDDLNFIFNIRLIYNTASWGQSFESFELAKNHCSSANKSKYSHEIYKNKIYNSLMDFDQNYTNPECVYQ